MTIVQTGTGQPSAQGNSLLWADEPRTGQLILLTEAPKTTQDAQEV